MSSYSSSIKAIIQGRRHRVGDDASIIPTQALLVNMTDTPGQTGLDFATREVDMVQGLFTSASFESILSVRRKKDVMLHLPNCTIFHFASHGAMDTINPSRSRLLLEDCNSDPVTVADLLQMNLRKRSYFVAYLSACGTGEIEDMRFFDEGVQLVSACQLAGFFSRYWVFMGSQ